MTMHASRLPRPGLVYGSYPQRQPSRSGLLGDLVDLAGHALVRRPWRRTPDFQACLAAQRQAHQRAAAETATELAEVRAALLRHGFTAPLVARAQCLIAQAMEEALGKRPFDTQHHAAWAMLCDRLVEMDTGEGKSLAILMAAATAGLAGMPVHVVTANDYLAARDAQAARPVLERLGLRVAAIDPAAEPAQRRAAYACDVVYCTARELGFDYLRDRMAARDGRPLLRGLCLALIDEADSVLIDHARTPLVIATAGGTAAPALPAECATAAYAFSATLLAGADFTLQPAQRRAVPAAAAVQRLHDLLAGLPDAAHAPGDVRVSAQALEQALVARHLLQRDRHYVVQPQDGALQVVLIDETTGRTLPGTHWTGGLHAFVALKEGCAPPPALRTAQSISLQGLFSRYWKLGGVSGTLRESRLELFAFYRLRVQRIRPRHPSRRRDRGLRVFGGRAERADAVLARVRACVAQGRPVLVGTESVAASEALAARLQRAGVQATVLNARHDAQEAALIARAGARGAVTVATNMAGRGTDIEPDRQAAPAGLHVIACCLNGSRRIDRQLLGRTARNGRPGSCETLLALDDGVFERRLSLRTRIWLAGWCGPQGLAGPAARWLARGVQVLQEQLDLLQRWRLVQHDRHMQDLLAGMPADLGTIKERTR
jgi:preprotein translocase subunit SecA